MASGETGLPKKRCNSCAVSREEPYRSRCSEVQEYQRRAAEAGEVVNALEMRPSRPHVIIAHTVKGKGVPRIEGMVSSHYHPATSEDLAILTAVENSCALL